MKKSLSQISGYFILVVFLTYYINISFFHHLHVIYGVTIIHSHLYEGIDGKAEHNHNYSEIQLISNISQFNTTGETIVVEIQADFFLIADMATSTTTYFPIENNPAPSDPRAPPLHYFNS